MSLCYFIAKIKFLLIGLSLRRSNPVVEDRSLLSHDDVMELGNSLEFFKTVFMSKCGVTYDLECPF